MDGSVWYMCVCVLCVLRERVDGGVQYLCLSVCFLLLFFVGVLKTKKESVDEC